MLATGKIPMLRPLSPRPAARGTSPRHPARWLMALAAGSCLLPAALGAQEPASTERVHVVKEGDTLWDLARVYLNDPFLWPEIYRINTAVVEDPHWIYPGERLQIPSGSGDAGPPPLISVDDQDGGPVLSSGPSVFTQTVSARRTSAGGRRQGIMGREATTAVREGEFYAAPFAVERDAQRGAGRILRSHEMSGIQEAEGRERLRVEERVYIMPPVGAQPAAGTRFLAYRNGPELENGGRVLIPTAVVEVITPGAENEASLARIAQIYDDIKISQRLLTMETFEMPVGTQPQGGTYEPTGNVVWIKDDAVLPTLQRYIVLSATARDGVKLGDQFTVVRRRDRSDDGVVIPEQPIAVAQVVRVTEYGTSAIVIEHQQPALKTGLLARMTARMP